MEFPFDRPLRKGKEEREGEKPKLTVLSYQCSKKTTEMTDSDLACSFFLTKDFI
jgi:hypothetical protein